MPEIAIIMTGSIIMIAVVGASINGIVQKAVDYKQSQAAMAARSQHAPQQVDAAAERTQMIEDRLRVLERIATDRGHLLSDEIEALRDQRISHEKSKERA